MIWYCYGNDMNFGTTFLIYSSTPPITMVLGTVKGAYTFLFYKNLVYKNIRRRFLENLRTSSLSRKNMALIKKKECSDESDAYFVIIWPTDEPCWASRTISPCFSRIFSFLLCRCELKSETGPLLWNVQLECEKWIHKWLTLLWILWTAPP